MRFNSLIWGVIFLNPQVELFWQYGRKVQVHHNSCFYFCWIIMCQKCDRCFFQKLMHIFYPWNPSFLKICDNFLCSLSWEEFPYPYFALNYIIPFKEWKSIIATTQPTTQNNFCWGGIIIGKKNHHTTTPPHHVITSVCILISTQL